MKVTFEIEYIERKQKFIWLKKYVTLIYSVPEEKSRTEISYRRNFSLVVFWILKRSLASSLTYR